ncbi:hypothetical protein NEHOM01_0725 [Nematocida homosporus]|uniref:uncharacterized protein n=1 Tax=Nematocida homosporus TaxID=1912981 RepID=UPI00221FF8E2|nr:uncharacterized protein NEHOM01_0725 [Nematocida homosporus]KAI5185267.1 hypothetical protein NEHOM01_0725 [Nematocida homosporus]
MVSKPPIKRHSQKQPYRRQLWRSWGLAAIFGILMAGGGLIVFRKLAVVFDSPLDYVISFPSEKTWKHKLYLREPVAEFVKRDLSEEELEHHFRRHYVIVQALKKNELVASVFLLPKYYQTSDTANPERYPVFEIYNVYVSPKHRGKRLSTKHLYTTFKYLQTVYNVDNSTLVGLHISPIDTHMPVAYALYRSSGFTNAAFSPYGPPSFQRRYEDIKTIPLADYTVNQFLLAKIPPKKQNDPPAANGNEKENEKENDPTDGSNQPVVEDRFLTFFADLETFYSAVDNPTYTSSEFQTFVKKGARLQKKLLSVFKYQPH